MRLLKNLDRYSLLTALAILALQFQFYQLSGHPIYEEGFRDYYVFTAGLIFFGIIIVYNGDHLLDEYFTAKTRLNPSLFFSRILMGVLSAWGILFLGIMGWELWDGKFLLMGLAIFVLCVVHIIIFHHRKTAFLFPLKEISVSSIACLGIIAPLVYYLVYYQDDQGYGQNNQGAASLFVPVIALFLVMANSVLFYSLTRRKLDQERGSRSLFLLLPFEAGRHLLMSFIFFSIINLFFFLPSQDPGGNLNAAAWYFLSLAIFQGVLAKLFQEDSNEEFFRLLSESTFLILLPFFL